MHVRKTKESKIVHRCDWRDVTSRDEWTNGCCRGYESEFKTHNKINRTHNDEWAGSRSGRLTWSKWIYYCSLLSINIYYYLLLLLNNENKIFVLEVPQQFPNMQLKEWFSVPYRLVIYFKHTIVLCCVVLLKALTLASLWCSGRGSSPSGIAGILAKSSWSQIRHELDELYMNYYSRRT